MRVFTFEEVLNGRVPFMKSFSGVERVLRSEVPKIGSVKWATLCGSYQNGGYSRASDIDLAICFDQSGLLSSHERTVTAIAELKRYATARNIPLQVIELVGDEYGNFISDGMLRHIISQAVSGGQIVGTEEDLPGIQDKAYSDAQLYVCRKLSKALDYMSSKWMISNESWHNDWLSDVISIHRHLARRLVEILGHFTVTNDKLGLTLYEVTNDGTLCDRFTMLEGLRSKYIAALYQQLEKPLDRKPWDEVITGIEEGGEALIEMLLRSKSFLDRDPLR